MRQFSMLSLIPVIAIIALIGAVSAPSSAAFREQGGPVGLLVAEKFLSLPEVIEIVRKDNPGEVVKAERTDLNGQKVYYIRLVIDGRVKDVWIDTVTGKLVFP